MPGTLPWLISHELRIEWRELTSQRGRNSALLVMAAITVGLVWLWSMLLRSMFLPLLRPEIAPEAAMVGGLVFFALVPIGVMLGINQSVKAVYERNDMDLLLQSPLPARTVFTSRLLGVAAYTFVAIGVFVLPLALAGLINGVPRLLGVVPVLLAVSVIGAALGMLITLLLVRLLGARRARVASQVFAALAGAIVYLVFQIGAFTQGDAAQAEFVSRFLPLFQPGRLLGVDSLIWLPGRALFLDPLATILLLAAAALLIPLTTLLLYRWFVLGASSSTTTVASRRRTSSRGLSFSRRTATWQVMLAKDWRALIRDPYLVSQSLLQLLYLLPLAFVIFYDQGELRAQLPLAEFAAAALIVLSGTLAANFARICMAGEEAMDLLIASPVTMGQLQMSKLLASVVPVWVFFLPLSLAVAFVDLRSGAVAVVLVLLSTLSVAWVRLRNPHRASRQDLFKRKGQGDQVQVFIEAFIPLILAVAGWLLATAHPLWWAAALGGLALPAIAIKRGQALGPAYGEPAMD